MFHAIFFVSAKSGEDVDFAFDEAARAAYKFRSGAAYMLRPRDAFQSVEPAKPEGCC
jgi:hypothetical protein